MHTIHVWLQRFPRLHILAHPTAESADEGPQAVVALSGISLQLWRMYGLFWLVCLGYAIFLLLETPLTPARLLLIVTSTALFAALYVWFIWPHPVESLTRSHAQFPRVLLLFVVFAALVLLLSLIDGPAWLWLFVCVSAVAGLIFPLPIAIVAVTGLTLLSLILGAVRVGWVQAIPLVLLVRGLGLDMIGLILLVNALRQLQMQRRALAHLAVTEERLRVARDLHDLLGRTLSVITLKSALAERLITTDPARAADEIRDVERVARATLREVRATIAGYRQPTLRSELDGARQILEAAGIAVALEDPQDTAGSLPPAADSVLAWVVREGVTNVLRHSRPTQCAIALACEHGIVRAEMTNDGCPWPAGAVANGNGLAGLTERVQALGGQLTAGPVLLENSGGFRLRVELPVRKDASGEQEV